MYWVVVVVFKDGSEVAGWLERRKHSGHVDVDAVADVHV
jgi:hypothetical protein